MSFYKPQVNISSNFASLFSVMKDNSFMLFQSNVIYFAQKEPIKAEILRIVSALFVQSIQCLRYKITEKLSFMTLNSKIQINPDLVV